MRRDYQIITDGRDITERVCFAQNTEEVRVEIVSGEYVFFYYQARRNERDDWRDLVAGDEVDRNIWL